MGPSKKNRLGSKIASLVLGTRTRSGKTQPTSSQATDKIDSKATNRRGGRVNQAYTTRADSSSGSRSASPAQATEENSQKSITSEADGEQSQDEAEWEESVSNDEINDEEATQMLASIRDPNAAFQ